MRYRLLGNSGLRVSELFLGAMTFAEAYRALERNGQARPRNDRRIRPTGRWS
jgi:aryl-alcohol dehydrogenase-like predicted oxidoreductase